VPSTYPSRRIPAYLLAALGLLALLVLGGIFLVRAQIIASSGVAHTIEVEVALTRTLENARAIESAARGYYITKRPEMLVDFQEGRQNISANLARVGLLIADNPVQVANLANLRKIVAGRIDLGQMAIERVAQGQQFEVANEVDKLRGRHATRQLADQVNLMIGIEDRLLKRRTRTAQNAVWMLTAAMLGSVVMILGLAMGVIYDAGRRFRIIEQARDEARLAAATAQAEMIAREEAEMQLRQAQKMESIGQLTGGIAHDFNNMLAIIIGSLDLAERRLFKDPDRARQSIDNAREGAQRAATLTARLLAFSRRQPLAPVALDANKLVSGMSEMLHRTLGEHIAVETVLAGGLWSTLADPGQLENALVNLALNARDAMADGGRLTIETANSHLDEAYAASHSEVAPGQYVAICVTDTGRGMPPDVIERAFDPFFTTKEIGKGTGLGLSQVFGFVKQSGGHVAIYSEVGEGTTVKLYLPRHVGAPASKVPAAAAEQLPHGSTEETILVVEDEQRVRHFAVDALRELGYTVLSASSGGAGLAIIKQQPRLDLLFTDVVMPEMNGRQLAEAARDIMPALPVLYTTGYTRNAVVHNGTLDPDVELLAKPFTIAQLAHKIRAVLDLRLLIDQ